MTAQASKNLDRVLVLSAEQAGMLIQALDESLAEAQRK